MKIKTSKLLAALKFAAAKHTGQRRKGPEPVPYINHPIEVAEMLARVAGVQDPDILIAAILHDTIEDTDTTAEEISRLFGETVASLVMECTDDKSLPKAERKQLQIKHAPDKSPAAKLIKIADKVSNVDDIALAPPKGWSKQRCLDYLDWSENVVKGLRGGCCQLDQLYDRSLKTARMKVSQMA